MAKISRKRDQKVVHFQSFPGPKVWARQRGHLQLQRSENVTPWETLKIPENHQNSVFSVFSCPKPLSRLGASGQKYKMYFSGLGEKGFWSIYSVILRGFLPKWVISGFAINGIYGKTGLETRVIFIVFNKSGKIRSDTKIHPGSRRICVFPSRVHFT